MTIKVKVTHVGVVLPLHKTYTGFAVTLAWFARVQPDIQEALDELIGSMLQQRPQEETTRPTPLGRLQQIHRQRENTATGRLSHCKGSWSLTGGRGYVGHNKHGSCRAVIHCDSSAWHVRTAGQSAPFDLYLLHRLFCI